MFKSILVACDGSEGSHAALIHAAILAKKLGAAVSALWVRSSLPHYPETVDEVDEEEEGTQEFYKAIKTEVQAVSSTHDVSIGTEIRKGHPAREIVGRVQEDGIDLVILGHHGHSRIWGRLLGHTADRVNEQANCSVLIVRSEKEEARYRRMLIGFDGSESSMAALECGLDIAKTIGSEVLVLWVHPTPASPYESPDEKRLNEKWAHSFFEASINPRIEDAAARCSIKVVTDFRIGMPAQILVSEAESGEFCLIVIGHQGHTGLWGRLLGGTADRVSHHAHCDVLIVRRCA